MRLVQDATNLEDDFVKIRNLKECDKFSTYLRKYQIFLTKNGKKHFFILLIACYS